MAGPEADFQLDEVRQLPALPQMRLLQGELRLSSRRARPRPSAARERRTKPRQGTSSQRNLGTTTCSVCGRRYYRHGEQTFID